MIESYFVCRNLRALQLDAPLLLEREEYLSHLVKLGRAKHAIRRTASILLRAVILLKMEKPRRISHAEIVQASIAEEWNEGAFKIRKLGKLASENFIRATTGWLRFHSCPRRHFR